MAERRLLYNRNIFLWSAVSLASRRAKKADSVPVYAACQRRPLENHDIVSSCG
ncbi:hypothetical protein GbCGDNIH2_7029 [Granulibacter bethesdensis]|nr:hypothetical protein GbCGDNIH2_7029 [Granulibacter bethesdensis]APH51102.1 hypothetical protein GbCGDNIH5_7029 [Granulibacter bethesdensis]